jgi:hypothetical protein
MAQGTDEWSAIKESGVRFGEAKRRLELLREELRPSRRDRSALRRWWIEDSGLSRRELREIAAGCGVRG